MGRKKKMTDKQKRFCDEYLKDLDSIRAYMSSYTNVKDRLTASKAAYNLMIRPHVREYLDEKLKEIESNKIADVAEIMEYLTNVMRGEEQSEELMTIGKGNGFTEITREAKKPTTAERTRAAELLGKRYGMFTDNYKAEISVPTFIGEDKLDE